MNWLVGAVRRYPVVAITVGVGVVGLVLAAAGQLAAVQWGISIYALAVAAMQAWGMVRDVLKGRWGIDILAIMAIIATVVVGEFWASLVIVLMLSGGEALEDFAAGRARRELSALLARAPQFAHRINGSDQPVDVPVSEIVVGDRMLVRPSEIVPVDGDLEAASGTFDESSLTGESLPVERVSGDPVLSGSVNGDRAVIIRATAIAADSQFQQIVALVAEAAESRAPIVRLADRYAVPFTVVSLLIAGVAWLLSGDPVRFAEVLVVATPCPLLIAAPVAFMGGMSRAAKSGIIVKGAGTLELLSRAKTIAFDKTGTLTHGEPTVVEVRPTGERTERELLALVASAEQYSSHVLASSLVATAQERGIELRQADVASEQTASGVSARIDGQEVLVGKLSHVASEAPDAEPTVIRAGQLALYVAVGGVFAGSIILSDSPRSNARGTLERLHSLGVGTTLMLTGDSWATANHVAEGLGIDDVRAELLPADKVEAIRGLRKRPVIMVGDGVNDAPVLAVSDVGIAMGAKGATAASESADVVIMVDDLSRVADAVAIGTRTTAIATQSIWLGIALSLGLMILGALGFLPAIAGAGLQEVVDLVTILGALRALGAGRSSATRQRAASRLTPSRVG